MSVEDARRRAERAANRLGKWRTVFTGWQLGTRPKGDPEADAVRDLQEARLLLRAEVSALTSLVVELVGEERVIERLAEEYEALDAMLRQRFPGIEATDEGLRFDERARETMRGWKP